MVYDKPGRLIPSRLRTPQGRKGLLVLSHWDARERWWVREMTITSSMNTFSNTGNIPTLHQPTVTVTTVTHTHWLPTVADPHHLPQVWFSGIYSCWLYSHYILQDIAKCSGYECTRNCISGYAHIYRVLLLYHPQFSILCSQAVVWYMPWSVRWNNN